MGVLRGCLMLVGLASLALVTACVVGFKGVRDIADPTRFTRTVDEDIAKTRRMVRDYLEVAELEAVADRGLKTRPSTLQVRDFSDGSVHLTLDSGAERLMEVVAKFTPVADGGTRVEIFSDAEKLAQAVRPRITAAAIHREIRQDLGATLTAIDDQRVAPGGFLVSRLIEGSRGSRLSRGRML